ncbi:hypothetical protein C8A01DRAFT_17431 [Parachaetomium inaequale]|uniref:Uncharacterized protein n=1 Tax=Parachaetomium inaequale TaxID=2588326 RepID=A0AAN6PCQ0_9PEZI|nr:hypothetical protein C8A01DRAFT_17431 [Parachaetomium inaequale]
MARLAVLVALLAHLQPALASFYTVTSYFVWSETSSKLYSTCVENCRYYTMTETLTVQPTVTPTATPLSTRTRTYTYDDVEVVSIFVAASAVAESDLVPTSTTSDNAYTQYVVPITWTAPSSCPTPFKVTTYQGAYLPYDVRPYVTAASTATSIDARGDSTVTYITKFLDMTALPPASRATGTPTNDYYYTYYVKNCRNPTATNYAEYFGPTYTADSGSGSGGGSSRGGGGSSDWDSDWTVCSAMTGCVALATWIIVVATILPLIFLLGFVESYCWFRRMMLGKSALRLGTVCWCCLSLWFILLTRKSPTRSEQDQLLLKQYWATLGAGTRIKYWFKYGLRWRYPVELLGNPDGTNPAVVMAAGAPPPPPPGQQGGDGTVGDGSEKMQATAQQEPVFIPYPGQPYPGQPYMQPVPGQPYPAQPGVPLPQGYMMMPVPPQGAYAPGQQPVFAPGPPPQMGDGQQQQEQQQPYPPFIPSPSPAQTGTTEAPSMQPTPPPPGQGQQQPPPPGTQQQHQPPQS